MPGTENSCFECQLEGPNPAGKEKDQRQVRKMFESYAKSFYRAARDNYFLSCRKMLKRIYFILDIPAPKVIIKS